MGEIATYLGSEIMSIVVKKAVENSKEFKQQTRATKAAVADDLKVQNEIYKIATHEMLDALETSEAQNEYQSKIIQKMEKEYGKVDEDFIKKNNISVELSDQKHRARKALHDHLAEKYKTEIQKLQMLK